MKKPAAPRLFVARSIYHGKALCSTCHPAYVSRPRLYAITSALGAPLAVPYMPSMYESRVKDTELCWRWRAPSAAEPVCDEPVRAVPPDFTHDVMRSIRNGHESSDLFATLAAGVSGAGMPPWRGTLTDGELWDLAWYVESLAELRGTPAATELRARLRGRDNVTWEAPPVMP